MKRDQETVYRNSKGEAGGRKAKERAKWRTGGRKDCGTACPQAFQEMAVKRGLEWCYQFLS